MKKLLLSVTTLAIAVFSISSFADRIVVTGDPVVLERSGDMYIAPSTIAASTDGYYYFTVNETKRVCYRTVQPSLAKVDLGPMNVRLGSDTVSLHCYTYSPDYFAAP